MLKHSFALLFCGLTACLPRRNASSTPEKWADAQLHLMPNEILNVLTHVAAELELARATYRTRARDVKRLRREAATAQLNLTNITKAKAKALVSVKDLRGDIRSSAELRKFTQHGNRDHLSSQSGIIAFQQLVSNLSAANMELKMLNTEESAQAQVVNRIILLLKRAKKRLDSENKSVEVKLSMKNRLHDEYEACLLDDTWNFTRSGTIRCGKFAMHIKADAIIEGEGVHCMAWCDRRLTWIFRYKSLTRSVFAWRQFQLMRLIWRPSIWARMWEVVVTIGPTIGNFFAAIDTGVFVVYVLIWFLLWFWILILLVYAFNTTLVKLLLVLFFAPFGAMCLGIIGIIMCVIILLTLDILLAVLWIMLLLLWFAVSFGVLMSPAFPAYLAYNIYHGAPALLCLKVLSSHTAARLSPLAGPFGGALVLVAGFVIVEIKCRFAEIEHKFRDQVDADKFLQSLDERSCNPNGLQLSSVELNITQTYTESIDAFGVGQESPESFNSVQKRTARMADIRQSITSKLKTRSRILPCIETSKQGTANKAEVQTLTQVGASDSVSYDLDIDTKLSDFLSGLDIEQAILGTVPYKEGWKNMLEDKIKIALEQEPRERLAVLECNGRDLGLIWNDHDKPELRVVPGYQDFPLQVQVLKYQVTMLREGQRYQLLSFTYEVEDVKKIPTTKKECAINSIKEQSETKGIKVQDVRCFISASVKGTPLPQQCTNPSVFTMLKNQVSSAMPVTDNYSDLAQSITFMRKGQPLYCYFNIIGIMWNVGVGLYYSRPLVRGGWLIYEVVGRFLQADVLEASRQALSSGSKTRFYIDKTAIQASTETVMSTQIAILAIMYLQNVDIDGFGVEVNEWTRALFDFLAINGDVGMLTNLALSIYSLYTSLGDSAQWAIELARREEEEGRGTAPTPTEFSPNCVISMIRVLETFSVSMTVVVATYALSHQYVYCIVASTTFISFLAVDSIRVAAVKAFLSPICPLAMIWPWNKPCAGKRFLCFHLVRCAVMWSVWAWIYWTGWEQVTGPGRLDVQVFQDCVQRHEILSPSKIFEIIKVALACGGFFGSILLAFLVFYLHAQEPPSIGDPNEYKAIGEFGDGEVEPRGEKAEDP